MVSWRLPPSLALAQSLLPNLEQQVAYLQQQLIGTQLPYPGAGSGKGILCSPAGVTAPHGLLTEPLCVRACVCLQLLQVALWTTSTPALA